MTIKTLSYIHNLLINAEASAAIKLKWTRDTFNQAADDYDAGAISKSRYESAKDDYDRMFKEHCEASAALQEFEQRDWT